MLKLKQKLSKLPVSPGVYLMKDDNNKIIYVGKAKNLKSRVSSYFIKQKKDLKTKKLISHIHNFEIIIVSSEEEALILERSLIREHSPHYNILLRDDKNFPYLEIDHLEKWPRLKTVRKKRNKKALYFGPFTNAGKLRSLLHHIHEIFPLIRCTPYEFSKRKKPCHYYHMKKCLGPCTLPVKSSDYKNIIEAVMATLKGKDKGLEKILTNKMLEASEEENYELAASYRDQILAFKRLKIKQSKLSSNDLNQDIIGLVSKDCNYVINVLKMRKSTLSEQRYFVIEQSILDKKEVLRSFLLEYYERETQATKVYLPLNLESFSSLELFLKKKSQFFSVPQKGENKKLIKLSEENANYHLEEYLNQRSLNEKDLEEIKKELDLKNLPRTMECLDISNLQETATVASLVCFKDLKPKKSHYRIYNIKNRLSKPDDYESIREAFKRRLERALKENDAPDLFIIDGGKGQLSAASGLLKEYKLNCDLISLAKQRTSKGEITKEERIFFTYSLKSKTLSKYSLSYRILTQIRDEAHRFAITRHRKKRTTEAMSSTLLEIKGLGPKTHQRLLENFKGLDLLKKASLKDLMIKGKVKEEMAKAIRKKLKS